MVRLMIVFCTLWTMILGATDAMAELNQEHVILRYLNRVGLESRSQPSFLTDGEWKAVLEYKKGEDGQDGTDDDRRFELLEDVLKVEGLTLKTLVQLMLNLDLGSSPTIPSPRKILRQVGIYSIGLDFVYEDTEYQIKNFDNRIVFEAAILQCFDFIVNLDSQLSDKLLSVDSQIPFEDQGARILQLLDRKSNVFGLLSRQGLESLPWQSSQPKPDHRDVWVFFMLSPDVSDKTHLLLVARDGSGIDELVIDSFPSNH